MPREGRRAVGGRGACARLGDRERAAGYLRYAAELFRRAQAYRHADRARERLSDLLEMRN
ncbi:hypothetical protein O1L55_18955 [Streptomyces albulus]|nr:hypothetical protein [Streptomyces noursei]